MKTITTVLDLFAGESLPLGGLSNENDLAEICPQEFKSTGNRWSGFARLISRGGINAAGNYWNWRWKSTSLNEREYQLRLLLNLLDTTFVLNFENRVAIAGWMLSEM